MIRREFFKTAGTAALAGMIAFSPMAATAGSSEPAVRPAALTEFSVPLRNMSEDTVRFVNRMAARVSKDALVVVFYGSNPAVRDEIRFGASEAKNEGRPVRGMIQAQGPDNTFRIYADGLPVTDYLGPENARDLAKEAVRQADDEIIKQELLSLNR